MCRRRGPRQRCKSLLVLFFRKELLTFLCLSAWSLPAPAESLRDALAAAYGTNPTLRGQQATQRATDETAAQARAGWRPVVSVTAGTEYLREPNSIADFGAGAINANDAQASLNVTQPIYTGGRVRNAVRAADARVSAGQQGLRLTEAQTFQTVILAYMDVLRDQNILEVRRADLETLQLQVTETNSRFHLGAQVTRTDVAQAEAQQQQAAAALAAAEAQLEASRASYRAAVGEAPGTLAQPDSLPGCPRSLEAAMAQAVSDNPALAQDLRLADASEADIDTARSGRLPTVGVQGSFGTIGPAAPLRPRTYQTQATAMLTFTQPLISGGLIDSQVRQAEAKHEADRQTADMAARQATAAVATAWSAAEAGARQIAANTGQVKAAETALRGNQLEYGYGLRTTLDVLIADENLRAAQVALAQSRHDTIVAQAALLAATGRLEARWLLPDQPEYDPTVNARRARTSNAVPWEGAVAALDRGGRK